VETKFSLWSKEERGRNKIIIRILTWTDNTFSIFKTTRFVLFHFISLLICNGSSLCCCSVQI
jgi:hypothetical protein